MKLFVHNKTVFNTRALRRFFLAGIRAYGLEPKYGDYVIEVVYQTRLRGTRWVHGKATMHGRWVQMFLPRPINPDQEKSIARLRERGIDEKLVRRYEGSLELDVADLALVFEHELAHNAGLGHADMTDDVKWCRGPVPTWASGFLPADFAPAPPKPKPSRAERLAALKFDRECAAREKLERWERRLKLARTKVAKYRLAVRGYERRKVATPKPEECAWCRDRHVAGEPCPNGCVCAEKLGEPGLRFVDGHLFDCPMPGLE
jgi:hypothetical protein